MSNLTEPLGDQKQRKPTDKERVLFARETLAYQESELLAREKAFKIKEASLVKAESEAAIRLTVIDKQIAAKEKLIESVNDQNEGARRDYRNQIDSLTDDKNEVIKQIQAKQLELAAIDKKLAIQETLLEGKKSDQSLIQQEIKDLKQYFKDQERITEETIQEWNSTLVEFRKEADIVQGEKNKISADIIHMEQDKIVLSKELDEQSEKLEALILSYELKTAEYRGQLKEMDDKLLAKKTELDVHMATYETSKKDIETRTKSLTLKENDIKTRSSVLDQKERRLKMLYGNAGLDY